MTPNPSVFLTTPSWPRCVLGTQGSTPGRPSPAIWASARRQAHPRAACSAASGALVAFATSRHRTDLADTFGERSAPSADTAARAIDTLRGLPAPVPHIADEIDQWLPQRAAAALRAHGIRTLAELTVRIPRRRRWWTAIAGLGVASARRVEAFFAAHPALTERARALIVAAPVGDVVPWEQLRVPHEVDGAHGQFRAPRATCLLNASNDYEAIQSWLSLHESAVTQRAYRKEAERLILWAIVERGCALSSLTTDDAIAYRAFLRRPTPRERWVGPSRPRHSVEWRPFIGALSPRSAAYALNVLSALFRWLVEQRYVLANPFAGVKVKSHAPREGLDVSRGFSEGERLLIRTSTAQAPPLSRSLIKLAQLGGYLARANDPPPGNKVIWRGMHRLVEIQIGYWLGRENSG